MELNMMFVNFPVERIKRTFLLLVQRAEHFKETYIADKNKNVQKRVVQGAKSCKLRISHVHEVSVLRWRE